MSAATRLHVSGLPRDLLDDDLRARFTPFGAVSDLEVCREKENSPFFADGRTDDLAPSVRGGRGGRGGAGGRGKKKGRGGDRLPPSRPPPCRGYAFVTVAFPDDHALRRCLNAYNGTKWKGGTIHVHPAKPKFHERLRMEREGIHPGRPGMRAEVDDDDEALRGDDVNSDDETRRLANDGSDERQPLRPGDLLEIDGRVRNSKVTVTYARGATTHVKGEGSFAKGSFAKGLKASTEPSTPDWTPFPDDASNRTLRKLCQLPGLDSLWKPANPEAAGPSAGGRRRRRDEDDETEIIRDEDDDEDGTAGDDDDGTAGDGTAGDGRAGGGADRFNLPREFFDSDVAANRAARHAAGVGDDDTAGSAGSRSKRRKKDTVEMRALAAFLGSDSDDGDETEGADAAMRLVVEATRPAVEPASAKKPTRDAAASKPAATRLAEPEEGGIPMAKAGSRWWESGSAAPGAAGMVTGTGTLKGTGGGLAKDFFATRLSAPARDFFRAGGSAPFAARSKSSAGADTDDDGAGDGEDSDGDVEIDVDSDAFSEDDESAEPSDDDDGEEEEEEGSEGAASSDDDDDDDEGVFEDESNGSEDGEGDSDSGDLGVVDFD